MTSKLDTNKPYGKVLGFVQGVVGARFSQDGKLFNAQHEQVFPVEKAPVKEPEPEVVVPVKEPEVKEKVKASKDKAAQLPPGLPTKE